MSALLESQPLVYSSVFDKSASTHKYTQRFTIFRRRFDSSMLCLHFISVSEGFASCQILLVPRSVMTEVLHEIWEGWLGMTCLCRGWWEHRPPEWWWSQTTLLAHRTIRRPPRQGPSRASWSSPGTQHGPTQCCPTLHPLDCIGRKGGSNLYNTLVLHNVTTSKHRQASSKVIAKNVLNVIAIYQLKPISGPEVEGEEGEGKRTYHSDLPGKKRKTSSHVHHAHNTRTTFTG